MSPALFNELREKQVERLLKFLKAQEAWEAAVLNDESPWFDQMPEELLEGFQEVQKLRNEAKGDVDPMG